MIRNDARRDRIREALRGAGLDALVVSLPTNVLLLSGYWPVVGTSLALATRDGTVAVLAPEDERGLTETGWADAVHTFHPGSLKELTDASRAVREPLAAVGRHLGLERRRIGCEAGAAYEPATYSSMHLYGAGLPPLLGAVFPAATVVPADGLLASLRAVLTPTELDRLRKACHVAGQAFAEGFRQVRLGARETEVAAAFRAPLGILGTGADGVERAGGFAWCMSGPHSAEAFGAYARSRSRPLQAGDLVLVHCNSYADGYWTDITRTYTLGPPDDRQRSLHEAVLAARAAALGAIRPGVRGRDVDEAARDVLRRRGYGDLFKHGTGHGVGFAAINHNARPRIHPASDDVLEAGMVFNVEPAVYIDGYGGIRHCDVVTVTDTGAEVLTPFQASLEELVRPAG